MSEERFDRIEVRLDRLDAGQGGLEQRVGRLEFKVDRLETKVDRLEAKIEDLDRHMHVLHEDTVARIAGIAEYTGPTKAEMKQGFAELRELIERRIVPIEIVIRNAIAEGKL